MARADGRRWVRRLGALALGLVFAVVAAELCLRLLAPTTLGFEYRDGEFQRPSEYVEDTTENSLGFHDTEPRPKTADRRRVLLVGDSYVQGYSVGVEETVGKRLEVFLEETVGPRWDVVSVGTSGWGQKRELQALKEHGLGLAPDVVVTLFLSLNDLRDNSERLERLALHQLVDMQRFRPGWQKLPAQEAPLFFLESSVLNQLISHRLALGRSRQADGMIPLDYFAYAVDPDPVWRAARNNTERLLSRTRLWCDSVSARYAVVAASTPHGVLGAEEGLEHLQREYPAMREHAWDLDQVDRWLGQFCAGAEIPFLALEPVFREAHRQGQRLHWPYDGHWNAAGNDRAAQEIGRFLISAGLVR